MYWMDHDERLTGRAPRGARVVLGLMGFALVLGLSLLRDGSREEPGPPQPQAAAREAAVRAPAEGTGDDDKPGAAHRPGGDPAGALEPLSASHPETVRIAGVGVDAPVTDVGLDEEGWLQAPPPQEPNLAGWYSGAVTPGEAGTAVLVGHVDNDAGPAVFYGLGAVKDGQSVEVAREDGVTAHFTVYDIAVYDKKEFPREKVYGDTDRAELRVITCGGGYESDGGYQGNVVVYARLTKVT